MLAASAYQHYQNNSVATASPGELTLMLYNGAIKFCNLTIEAIEGRNIPKANEYNIKVQNIITELQVSLDTRYEVGRQMDQIYSFIQQLLVEGNIEKNRSKVEEALHLIREFRDTWQEVLKSARA